MIPKSGKNSAPIFIAEVKTRSPYGFCSSLCWEALLEIAVTHGDYISIHTDPRWGGSFEHVSKARAVTKKPILAKGIHATDDDVKRALGAGADHVLVVGRLPAIHFDRCWFEPRFILDFDKLSISTRVVWNSRDLRDGSLRLEKWAMARQKWTGWMCQASNIKCLADVEPTADAFLVGEHMVRVAKELRG